MCNCIEEVEQKMLGVPGLNATKAELQKGIMFSGKSGGVRPYLNCTIETEGKKKPQVVPVSLKYCPFCGEKYDLGDDAKGVADNG